MANRRGDALVEKSGDKPGDKVDERLVDGVVEELRRLVIGGQVGVVVRVGQIIIERFFGGVENARSRDPAKPASLRRLADRAAEFGMTRTGLMQSVSIAVQSQQLGKRVSERLTPSHHVALLPVHDPKERAQLAASAVEKRWTVAELRNKMDEIQARHPGGRPRAPRVRLLVSKSYRMLGKVPAKELGDGLEAIDGAEARKLAEQLTAVRGTLDRIEKLLVQAASRG